MRTLRFVSPLYSTIFIKGLAPMLVILGILTVLKPEASAVPSYSGKPDSLALLAIMRHPKRSF